MCHNLPRQQFTPVLMVPSPPMDSYAHGCRTASTSLRYWVGEVSQNLSSPGTELAHRTHLCWLLALCLAYDRRSGVCQLEIHTTFSERCAATVSWGCCLPHTSCLPLPEEPSGPLSSYPLPSPEWRNRGVPPLQGI